MRFAPTDRVDISKKSYNDLSNSQKRRPKTTRDNKSAHTFKTEDVKSSFNLLG